MRNTHTPRLIVHSMYPAAAAITAGILLVGRSRTGCLSSDVVKSQFFLIFRVPILFVIFKRLGLESNRIRVPKLKKDSLQFSKKNWEKESPIFTFFNVKMGRKTTIWVKFSG